MAVMCNKMPSPNEGNPDKGYYCCYCGLDFRPGVKVEVPHIAANIRPFSKTNVISDQADFINEADQSNEIIVSDRDDQ